jgi:hypothetical protein
VKSLFFCGVHGLPLRGQNEDCGLNIDILESRNNGVFKGLLQFRLDAGDVHLKNHFESMTARTMYFSNRIQNELKDATRILIQEKQSIMAQKSNFFSILADETTDVSTTEQLTFVIRYVYEDIIREDFFGFVEVKDLKSESLAFTLVQLISQFNLSLQKLRGQGYDGAAVMSGCSQGVQTRIATLVPLALYTHCANHCLNLVICKACTIPVIRNMYLKLLAISLHQLREQKN